VAVAAAAGCGGAKTPPPLSDGPFVQFGYVRSLTPVGTSYRLRFDLALRLSGATAARACVDNDRCPTGTSGFPDDVYDRDLHYVLTYRVPRGARVTLVASGHPTALSVTPAELYGLAHGRNPRRLRVMDPTLAHLGFYVEVEPAARGLDVVTRLEQAYHP
jgi:hypothetical protein